MQPAFFLLAVSLFSVLPAAAFDTTHQALSRELNKYVKDGRVGYARWKKDFQASKNSSGLGAYIESLATISQDEYNALSVEDRKALWLNAYNALTIQLVLNQYPIAGKSPDYPANSFRQIPDAWEKYHFNVAGSDVTLDEIEHTILRRDFHDNRTHFAVVCAAQGSPHLLSHAFVGRDLDAALDQARAVFLKDPQNVAFDKTNDVLKVSKIFQWFPLDFASAGWFKKNKGKLPSDEDAIIEYLTENGPPEVKKDLLEAAARNTQTTKHLRVEYKPFDWSLNDGP